MKLTVPIPSPSSKKELDPIIAINEKHGKSITLQQAQTVMHILTELAVIVLQQVSDQQLISFEGKSDNSWPGVRFPSGLKHE